jgi:catechol 2,3-dioxygenase-like lactoylglutathione lyase family enzyme
LPKTIPNAAGIRAFYFKDPDGHPLEILEFPPEKGAAKWHAKTDRLFLGIDHTAIVVADTERSLGFYRDTLGFAVAGESENFGTEHEHLNNVFGARLRITGLRAASGPGIELLEYLAPRDGRPVPADLRANDLAHWQTRLITGDASEASAALARRGRRLVSPGRGRDFAGGTRLPSRRRRRRSRRARDTAGRAMRHEALRNAAVNGTRLRCVEVDAAADPLRRAVRRAILRQQVRARKPPSA